MELSSIQGEPTNRIRWRNVGLFHGFVPPTALGRRQKAGVPEIVWNLRGRFEELDHQTYCER
jgi:hypothetical protein